MKIYCRKCGYNFEPKTSRVPARCPNCDQDGLVVDQSSKDLVREV